MAKRRTRFFRWFLLALVLAVAVLTFRQGWIPARYTFLPAVDLAKGNGWFIDWRLAELKYDKALCRSVLTGPNVRARPISDNPFNQGCGWVNAVRLSSVGGASLTVGRLSCEVSAALALWIAHDVQPVAQEMLGARVTSVRHMGSYSCRNIIGHGFWRKTRSEHASANALDIAGFALSDGSSVSVVSDWNGGGKKAAFLREIHRRACRYFRVAIGPDYNAAHHNHFHYDRGVLSRCK